MLISAATGTAFPLGQRVFALVEHIVDAEQVGSLSLKGFLRPVPTYNVVVLKEVAPPIG